MCRSTTRMAHSPIDRHSCPEAVIHPIPFSDPRRILYFVSLALPTSRRRARRDALSSFRQSFSVGGFADRGWSAQGRRRLAPISAMWAWLRPADMVGRGRDP